MLDITMLETATSDFVESMVAPTIVVDRLSIKSWTLGLKQLL